MFDAPIDKIWKYLDDAPNHQHRSVKLGPVLEQKGNVIKMASQTLNPDGKSWRKETLLMTMNPPKGYTIETLDGPREGTKFTQTYTPQGGKSRVIVEGDFVNPGVDEGTLRKGVLSFFEEVFNEDQASLRKFK